MYQHIIACRSAVAAVVAVVVAAGEVAALMQKLFTKLIL